LTYRSKRKRQQVKTNKTAETGTYRQQRRYPCTEVLWRLGSKCGEGKTQVSIRSAMHLDQVATMSAMHLDQVATMSAMHLDQVTTMSAMHLDQVTTTSAMHLDQVTTMSAMHLDQVTTMSAMHLDQVATWNPLTCERSYHLVLERLGLGIVRSVQINERRTKQEPHLLQRVCPAEMDIWCCSTQLCNWWLGSKCRSAESGRQE
jgi:Ni2+-binding GTPase involved in maturation of urease and hydrogenase